MNVMQYPDYAGCNNIDDALTLELQAAGIQVVTRLSAFIAALDGVKTVVTGELHGWEFRRSQMCWVATGPGLPLEYAQELYETHDQSVRVAGHYLSPSPLKEYGGLAVNLYHVDCAAGLRALARMISACVSDAHKRSVQGSRQGLEPGIMRFPVGFQVWVFCHMDVKVVQTVIRSVSIWEEADRTPTISYLFEPGSTLRGQASSEAVFATQAEAEEYMDRRLRQWKNLTTSTMTEQEST